MNIATITVTNIAPDGVKTTTIYYINTITGQIVDPLGVFGALTAFPVLCVGSC